MDNIKAKAKQFLKEYKLQAITLENLRSTIQLQGYTIVEYNSIANNENVASLIDALGLKDAVISIKGFTYADSHRRLVFVHESLSDEEKRLVLAHEIGHIYCGHLSSSPILGKDVIEEYEANEFMHYILNPSVVQRVDQYIKIHTKAFVGLIAVLVLIVVGGMAFKMIQTERSYYGEYYITSTGNKYHEKECIFVKDKKDVERLTKEQFESGEYEPCGTCLPE